MEQPCTQHATQMDARMASRDRAEHFLYSQSSLAPVDVQSWCVREARQTKKYINTLHV